MYHSNYQVNCEMKHGTVSALSEVMDHFDGSYLGLNLYFSHKNCSFQYTIVHALHELVHMNACTRSACTLKGTWCLYYTCLLHTCQLFTCLLYIRANCIRAYCIRAYCIRANCKGAHCIRAHCMRSHCIRAYCILAHCIRAHCIRAYCNVPLNLPTHVEQQPTHAAPYIMEIARCNAVRLFCCTNINAGEKP